MQTHTAEAQEMLVLSGRNAIGKIRRILAALGVHKGSAEPVPDRRHERRAIAHRVHSFVKVEIALTIRTGLEQFFIELECLDGNVRINKTLNLVGRGVPQFAAERPENLVPVRRDLVIASRGAAPVRGVSVWHTVLAAVLFKELGDFKQVRPLLR